MKAQGGQKGLALLDRLRPDAVFLDIRMPEMGGLAVLRWIRATDPGLPVITGHARQDDLDQARRLGVTGIIEKPLILNRLTDALARLEAGP